jgi:hypothetical protein
LKEIKKDFMLITFKEIFQFNNFFHKIKLDKSEKDFTVIQGEGNSIKEKVKDEQSQGNEWNQEYELIYLSYVLEK